MFFEIIQEFKDFGYNTRIHNRSTTDHEIILDDETTLTISLDSNQVATARLTKINDKFKIDYSSETVVMNCFDNYIIYDLHPKNEFIEFSVFTSKKNDFKYFEDVKELCLLRYIAKPVNIDLLKVELSKYTNNNSLLDYFSNNKLIC